MASPLMSYSLLLVLTTGLPLMAMATTPAGCDGRLAGRARSQAAARGRRKLAPPPPTSPQRAPLQACSPLDSGSCEPFIPFACSPRVTRSTVAGLTRSTCEEMGENSTRCSCDGRFHSDSEMVVALSTGWYSRGRRCGKHIVIRANGRTARATVVNECDSMHGCDEEHNFKPPCANNVIGGTSAVWVALGFGCDTDDWSEQVTWSDA